MFSRISQKNEPPRPRSFRVLRVVVSLGLAAALAASARAPKTAPPAPPARSAPAALGTAPTVPTAPQPSPAPAATYDLGIGALEAARARLAAEAAAGGWPDYPPTGEAQGSNGKLELGLDDPERVPALRARLAALGDLDPVAAQGTLFDDTLDRAVRHFQVRHGLEPDGKVGRKTTAALAVPPEERIRGIDASLARRRELLAQPLGDRFVLVNIPAYQLELVEDGARAMAMRVVVGRLQDATPELDTEITELELNPYWNVPIEITREELAKKESEEPGRLARLRIRAFTDGSAAHELDVTQVDWAAVARGESDLFLRQDPGPVNSLGRIKFRMPNDKDIYLHDTPEKDLFEESGRAFSHGCIRVENALFLATELLKSDPQWTEATLEAALATGEHRTVKLAVPVPVHVVYWTAWIDANGTLQLRDDVYNIEDTGPTPAAGGR